MGVWLLPQSCAVAERIREYLIESAAGFRVVRAGAEVSKDNQLIFEAVGTVEEVIEVHVAELMNFFAAVFGPEEGHFGDQQAGVVDIGVCIESLWGGVAGEADERAEEFRGNVDALEFEIANLVTGESVIFGSEFFADVVDDVADRGDSVFCGVDGEAVFAGQIDSITRFHADEFAEHASAVELLPGAEDSPGIFHDFGRKIDDRWFHLHHSPTGDEDGESSEVIEVSVSDKKGVCAHEGPGACAEFEANSEFGDAPVALDGGA